MKFSIADLFKTQSTPAQDAQAERLAVAQLLLEIARADLKAEAAELAAIRSHLQQAFGLGEPEIDALIERAAQRVDASVSLYETVEIINRKLSAETKAGLVRALWRVAYADGRLDPYEEALLRRICDLLYVPHATFIQEKLALQGL